MDWPIIVILVTALMAVGIGAWIYTQRRCTQQLRGRFGKEYDRTIEEEGGRGKAEKVLKEREQRVEFLRLRPLTPEDQERFQKEWQSIQARFVDDPKTAVTEADWLVHRVMRARGYPTGDFEQEAADVSVDHPEVVSNYRAAHAIAVRAREEQGTTTETLRQGLVFYRRLFDDLLEVQEPVLAEVRR
ncbi:MAG: hypothetical protein L0387_24005 [Acidobacteria bacterium]|nr:hypothetical protein [Acidobacteriota bacterium]MCI0719716.1 hypothetical protein [Acidobacteriota bacterium]